MSCFREGDIRNATHREANFSIHQLSQEGNGQREWVICSAEERVGRAYAGGVKVVSTFAQSAQTDCFWSTAVLFGVMVVWALIAVKSFRWERPRCQPVLLVPV